MSNANNFFNTNMLAVTIGATIGVISSAMFFIIARIQQQEEHSMTNANLKATNEKLAALESELEELKALQNQKRKKRKAMRTRSLSNDNTYTATDIETDIDCYSIAGTEIGDDEFFDCSDSDIASGYDFRTSNIINGILNELSDIDRQVENKIEAAEIEDYSLEEAIYNKLQTLLNNHPKNVEIAWRFARACHDYSACLTDNDKKKEIIEKGIEACKDMVHINDADLHKWYAILIGLLGDYVTIAEKIKNGYTFKTHVDRALEIRPEDSGLHHLIGRFKYEVTSLSWIQRKMAATFFSEPPSATFDDAIESFKQAEKFASKPHLENRLFLSKSYIAINQFEEAVFWLKKIRDEPIRDIVDRKVQLEAMELLDKYSMYDL
ncbi:regulator of microtubule dynamics protein 1-like [Prorops nasuta]|uniref:regulator of microtubule dynamics protein 1-like n=1 Tax=Prorops nasuta TaxID=863751 RepID=UPI0034CFDA8B